MKFTLAIELGNDAMRTAGDVADALEQVALNITRSQGGIFDLQDSGLIRDANGNTAGKWEVKA